VDLPVTAYRGRPNPGLNGLGSDATSLYWTNSGPTGAGQVRAVDKSGLNARTLYTNADFTSIVANPTIAPDLQVDNNYLWLGLGSKYVQVTKRAPYTVGTVITSEGGSQYGGFIDGTASRATQNFYMLGPNVMRSTTPFTTNVKVTTPGAGYEAASHVPGSGEIYFSYNNYPANQAQHSIVMVPLDGGAPQTLLSNTVISNPSGAPLMAAAPDGGIYLTVAGQVSFLDQFGNLTSTGATCPQFGGEAFNTVFANGKMYLTAGGAVYRFTPPAGPCVKLVELNDRVDGLVVDPDAVYFVTEGAFTGALVFKMHP
jgi:hypothetical protein